MWGLGLPHLTPLWLGELLQGAGGGDLVPEVGDIHSHPPIVGGLCP